MLSKALMLVALASPAFADQITLEYPDDGTACYYINKTIGKCEPLPSYIATPIQYATWIHANNGQIDGFQVMPNNPGGHWVDFTTISASGFRVHVDLIQPYGDCQAVLGFEVQNGVVPNAPDASFASPK